MVRKCLFSTLLFVIVFYFTSNLKCVDEVNYFFIVCVSLFYIYSFFYVFIFCFLFCRESQTGTILPCSCCMWDNIPWTLLRILFW